MSAELWIESGREEVSEGNRVSIYGYKDSTERERENSVHSMRKKKS